MLYVRMIKESKFSVKDGNLDNSVDRSNEYLDSIHIFLQ